MAKVLPTGGYFAIWMALQRCAAVTVYGFHFEPGFHIHHHYFNSEKPLKVHSLSREGIEGSSL